MNFEQLYKKILKHSIDLKKNKKINLLFHYYYEIWKINKQKLKLGLVTFKINEKRFDSLIVKDYIEIVYLNQDTTISDSKKISVLIEKFEWKWDKYNILSLLLIIIIGLLNVYVYIRNLIIQFIFDNNAPNDNLIILLQYNSKQTPLFLFNDFSIIYLKINSFLIDIIIELCTNFNILN